MNPVLILTRNNLALTKRCVESVRAQDIAALVEIIDNGSTDGTVEWAGGLLLDGADINVGVSAGWNCGLERLFSSKSVGCVLVIGNDTVLPPWFYRELLSYEVPFVTGVAVDNMEQIKEPPISNFVKHGSGPELTENPDFSAFLIRREAWEKIGPFDERMKLYCSDCDYHVRGKRLGVGMFKAPVAYYHERSSTLRLAPPAEQQEIQEQANKDRAVFQSLYGCLPGSKQYEDLFTC